MTIAEKLEYLDETKTNIKDSINYKGVFVEDNTPFRDYATLIRDITGGRYGMTVNTIVGTREDDVTVCPSYNTFKLDFSSPCKLDDWALFNKFRRSQTSFEFDFSGIEYIGKWAMFRTFDRCRGDIIGDIVFDNLIGVGKNSLSGTFYNTKFEGVARFPMLEEIASRNALMNTFHNTQCKGFDLSALKRGTAYFGMFYTFASTDVEEAVFDSLSWVGKWFFYGTFIGCEKLKVARFPQLIQIEEFGFSTTFNNTPYMTDIYFDNLRREDEVDEYAFMYWDENNEQYRGFLDGNSRISQLKVHFPAESEEWIKNLYGYDINWCTDSSARNKITIVFDL